MAPPMFTRLLPWSVRVLVLWAFFVWAPSAFG
jgi:hypothetical protein